MKLPINIIELCYGICSMQLLNYLCIESFNHSDYRLERGKYEYQSQLKWLSIGTNCIQVQRGEMMAKQGRRR